MTCFGGQDRGTFQGHIQQASYSTLTLTMTLSEASGYRDFQESWIAGSRCIKLAWNRVPRVGSSRSSYVPDDDVVLHSGVYRGTLARSLFVVVDHLRFMSTLLLTSLIRARLPFGCLESRLTPCRTLAGVGLSDVFKHTSAN